MSCNLYSVWKHHVHEICEIAWSSQRFFITEFFRGKGNNCFKSWQITTLWIIINMNICINIKGLNGCHFTEHFCMWSVKINLLKIKENIEHVQEISSVIKYVTSLLTQLSHSVCGLFFFLNSCLLWNMILERMTYKQHHCISLKNHQWRSYSLVNVRKNYLSSHANTMLCQKEIDRRKSLYFFIMMCHPLQDVMWCFS